jgi:hypothetical protein
MPTPIPRLVPGSWQRAARPDSAERPATEGGAPGEARLASVRSSRSTRGSRTNAGAVYGLARLKRRDQHAAAEDTGPKQGSRRTPRPPNLPGMRIQAFIIRGKSRCRRTQQRPNERRRNALLKPLYHLLVILIGEGSTAALRPIQQLTVAAAGRNRRAKNSEKERNDASGLTRSPRDNGSAGRPAPPAG